MGTTKLPAVLAALWKFYTVLWRGARWREALTAPSNSAKVAIWAFLHSSSAKMALPLWISFNIERVVSFVSNPISIAWNGTINTTETKLEFRRKGAKPDWRERAADASIFFSTKREEKENKNPRRALNLIWPALFALVIVLDGRKWQLLLQLLQHSKATAVFKLGILIKCVAWLYFNLNLLADPGSTSQSFSLLSGMKMLKNWTRVAASRSCEYNKKWCMGKEVLKVGKIPIAHLD